MSIDLYDAEPCDIWQETRVRANREWRALAGLAAAIAVLHLRSMLGPAG